MNKRIALHEALAGWSIQSDFDGTISLQDVTDTLLTRFGRPGWQELEDAWERGEIGSRECMKGQVALLDMSEDELHAHLDGIAIDPGFAGFVRAARAYGIAVQVVSDGLDHVIRHILGRHGLAHLPVFANRLVRTGERSWRMESPWASAQCGRASGNCKCQRLAHEQSSTGARVLYVGDSTSDFCVSGEADFVLAKYKLIDHCERHGIAHQPFTDFAHATRLLDGVLLSLESPA